MEDDKACITGLTLGLGIGGGHVAKKEKQKVNKPVPCLDLTFELYPKGEAIDDVNHDDEGEGFSLKKRSDEGHHQHPNGKNTDSTNEKNGSRKKLRLTKEQSALLEESFKLHTTLSQVFIHTKNLPSIPFFFYHFLFFFFSRIFFPFNVYSCSHHLDIDSCLITCMEAIKNACCRAV